jgi:hypothetical protein
MEKIRSSSVGESPARIQPWQPHGNHDQRDADRNEQANEQPNDPRSQIEHPGAARPEGAGAEPLPYAAVQSPSAARQDRSGKLCWPARAVS